MNKNIFIALAALVIGSSCSDNNYLPEIEKELVNLDNEYVVSSLVDEDDDSQKIETLADEASIQQAMDEYVQTLMNNSATAKQRIMRTVSSYTPNVVGVFKVGSCGTFKELTLLIDAEDRRDASRIEGEVGDSYVDGPGNVHLKFCLVSASRYYPGGVFLVGPINYTLILPKLAGSLNPTYRYMDIIVRYHDTEDKNPSNMVHSTHPDYPDALSISTGYTQVGNNAALAWGFPVLMNNSIIAQYPSAPGYIGPGGNIKYGVLSTASSGYIHIDDEDKNNKNWIKCYRLGTNLDNSFNATQAKNIYGILANGNTDYTIIVSTSEGFRKANRFYPATDPLTPIH